MITDVLSEDVAAVDAVVVDAAVVITARAYIVNTNKTVKISIVSTSFCITLTV